VELVAAEAELPDLNPIPAGVGALVVAAAQLRWRQRSRSRQ